MAAAEGDKDVPPQNENEQEEEKKTMPVTTIPENISSQKHPLQNSWTMWYDSPNTYKAGADWKSAVKKIVSFSSVEDFWCLFNNLVKPSGLPIKGNYHLFKEGIMPAWEDPINKAGGKWVIEFERRQSDILDQVWLYTSLALIGEQFDDMEDISGAVISCRKQRNRLALWTRSAMAQKTQMQIGTQFKKIMELPPRVKLGYQPHGEAMKRANISTRHSPSSSGRYEV